MPITARGPISDIKSALTERRRYASDKAGWSPDKGDLEYVTDKLGYKPTLRQWRDAGVHSPSPDVIASHS